MPEHSADTLDLGTLPFWMWDTVTVPPTAATESAVGITLDSLLPIREVILVQERPSLFRHHTMQVEHTSPSYRTITSEPAWIFITLVVLSTLLCLYYRIRHIKPLQLLKAAIDLRAQDRLVRDCNLNRGVVVVSMGLLMVSAMVLPAVRLIAPEANWYIYLASASAAGALYIVRNGLMRWLGNVFEHRNEVTQYITSNYLYHLIEATLLSAGLYPYFYLPAGNHAVLIVLGILMALAFVMRMFRGGKIILSQPKGSCFYLFYYLCIVELAPALVALRLFISQ